MISEIKAVKNSDGFVSLKSHTDNPERFFQLEEVYIDVYGDKRIFYIEFAEIAGKDIFVKFENFNSDYDVEFLVNKKMYVDSESLVELPEDTYFVHDLVGSRVVRASEEFGVIREVMSLSCHDVYVIDKPDGKEILIPAVKEFILEVDIPNKVISMNPDVDLGALDED
ncbi:MAG: ribosome maturation factor RimM [Rhodothermaceae bacterium]